MSDASEKAKRDRMEKEFIEKFSFQRDDKKKGK
jgi:hypothetical protein